MKHGYFKTHLTLLAIIVLLCHVPSAFAEELTPAKEADIKKLLGVTRAWDTGLQFMNTILQQMARQARSLRSDIPDRFFEILNQEINILFKEKTTERGGLIDQMVAIYSKYYIHKEIKGLLEFYQTELGKKTIKVLPKVTD